jgi:hypothetical protein
MQSVKEVNVFDTIPDLEEHITKQRKVGQGSGRKRAEASLSGSCTSFLIAYQHHSNNCHHMKLSSLSHYINAPFPSYQIESFSLC